MLGPQTVLAEFGELHPAILRAQGIDGRAVGFEVFLDRLPQAQEQARALAAAAQGLAVPAGRPRLRLRGRGRGRRPRACSPRCARADKALIREVALFDVYSGPGLGEGTKSLAVAVRLQAPDHTLTEPEIDAAAKKITAAAGKATGATLRQLGEPSIPIGRRRGRQRLPKAAVSMRWSREHPSADGDELTPRRAMTARLSAPEPSE